MTRERRLKKEEGDRCLIAGLADFTQCDNRVTTSKYTLWTFLPVALAEQFRRFANVYFAVVGFIMLIGWYSNAWDTAVSPWTIFGPLCLVLSFSLLVEGLADVKRHQNDHATNHAPCVVLHRISRNDWDPDNNAANKRKRKSSKKKKKGEMPMDLSEHHLLPFTIMPHPLPEHPNHHPLLLQDSKLAKKFRKGITIQRHPTLNQGNDIVVPLTPTSDLHAADNTDPLRPTTPAIIIPTTSTRNANAGPQQPQPQSQPQQPQPQPQQPQPQQRICFQTVSRQDIRQGQFILVTNRQMVPADMILVASSADHGSAYIETSSIDGETNLKLRTRATIPDVLLEEVQRWKQWEAEQQKQQQAQELSLEAEEGISPQPNIGRMDTPDSSTLLKHESLDDAVKRIARYSALGFPGGIPITHHPTYIEAHQDDQQQQEQPALQRFLSRRRGSASHLPTTHQKPALSSPNLQSRFRLGYDASRDFMLSNDNKNDTPYVATLTTEPPNAFVHSFSGKLTLPTKSAFAIGNGDNHNNQESLPFVEVPLDAEQILLRGSLLRNTQWAIGLVCFTGNDTKLVQNSFETPSKLSQLDRLLNWTVFAVLVLLCLVNAFLAALYVTNHKQELDHLWYVGYYPGYATRNGNRNGTITASPPWPYLPNLSPPEWKESPQNWLQMFFLFLTLLNNVIPMSLYVTVEFMTFAHQWFINVDQDMYCPETNTRAIARSTNVTDLGRVQYVFSDKTGTLTQNVMRFKRCSVNGHIYGAPVSTDSTMKPRGRPRSNTTTTNSSRRRTASIESRDSFDMGGSGVTTRGNFAELRNTQAVDNGHRTGKTNAQAHQDDGATPHHPLASLLNKVDALGSHETLSFNAEMFLRVMSLCHTVVVEKDLDHPTGPGSGRDDNNPVSKRTRDDIGEKEMEEGIAPSASRNCGNENRSPQAMKERLLQSVANSYTSLGTGMYHNVDDTDRSEGVELVDFAMSSAASDVARVQLPIADQHTTDCRVCARDVGMGPDGAPYGFAFQSESPDEASLVASASKTFGFQVITRNSSGIQLQVHPKAGSSILANPQVVQKLKMGQLTLPTLAAQTASKISTANEKVDQGIYPRVETWTVLAINKFDSDRKRMSIVVRSPPELGSLPIVFCKGADVSILDPKVSTCVRDENGKMPQATAQEQWEIEQYLEMEGHLGDFASEGLRTLVLGMKLLTEKECEKWLSIYKHASTAMKNRDELLKAAAVQLEKNLFIVGATAIEDKLQKDVPKTISTLGKAGIKIWVLTGDKRETAVEIGYSTHVLTDKMHLTQVADDGAEKVRSQLAMEFIRLVKMGSLHQYQRAVLEGGETRFSWEYFFFRTNKIKRRFWRAVRKLWIKLLKFCGLLGKSQVEMCLLDLEKESLNETRILRPAVLRRNVRNRAEKILREYIEAHQQKQQFDRLNNSRISFSARLRNQHDPSSSHFSDISSRHLDDVPLVFNRAKLSKYVLTDFHEEMKNDQAKAIEVGKDGIEQIQNLDEEYEDDAIVDEDCLSMDSIAPEVEYEDASDFDRSRHTFLERIFAVDKAVRKGQLGKHLKKSRRMKLANRQDGNGIHLNDADDVQVEDDHDDTWQLDAPRALVIEGAALKHMFGDAELEQLLFAVASHCSSVIACRVSPKQKAQLVNLVRQNVVPEPVTLAIGDGANDVGMIQEAHVGVGISGKEGQQAVNASDFAIAQFRFLEELILIHGRWNFFRMSTMILFQFYKNACMVGCLIIYTFRTLFSGTSLFQPIAIPLLNFVSAIPIFVLGVFDRCLSKDYIRRHPEVFQPARQNELVTFRVLLRWVVLVLAHSVILFFGTVYELSFGGGTTSAFEGMMAHRVNLGDGEGGDLKSVGTVTFSCLIILLAYKVLLESRSLIHGIWPAFTCRKDVGEGFIHRLAYTWHGVIFLSIGFYFFFIVVYNLAGRGFVTFGDFVNVAFQVMSTRSLVWVLILFVPLVAMALDVCGKTFSNMYFPTQTQIHLEIEYLERRERREKRQRRNGGSA